MVNDLFGIVGSVIAGTYEVEAVVAEGGFAVVYRAHHTGFRAPVALKCLKLSRKLTKDRQAQFLAQFKAEAALLFQLSASIPTVVRPLHIDALITKDGTFVPYMVLEWLEGETLAAIIEQREAEGRPPPPLKKLVRLLTPVAKALARAHEFTAADGSPVRIVHCDIKPENIFVANVAGEQVVKILDFGVAKAQSVASEIGGGTGAGQSGVHSFTPAYAAPEQWAPDKYGETGPWTDVWGLALTLVEATAGRSIIEGDLGAMMGIALDPIARPTPRNNDVDVNDLVESVFESALALEPRKRQPDVGVFWDELADAIGMREGGARDARREVGAVIREERVDVSRPKPQVQTRIKKLRLGPAGGKPAPKPKKLTVPDPFELDDPPLRAPPPRAAPPRDLAPKPTTAREPPKPSAPDAAADGPGLLGGLEASIPSIPPNVSPARLEASLPSAPPGPRRANLEADFTSGAPDPAAAVFGASIELDRPAQSPVTAFELEAPHSSASGLEASLRPPAQHQSTDSAAIELAVSDSMRPKADPRAERTARTMGAARAAMGSRAGLPDVETVRPSRSFGLIGVGVGAILVAIVLGLVDRALRGEDGQPPFSLGPVTLTLIAGLLMVVGVGLLVYRLLPRDR